MVRTRKAIYVGNQEVQRRYIGNKLIFENLVDMDTKVKVSGVLIFTDKADNSVVHVDVDGVIGGLNNFDVVSSVGKRNLIPKYTSQEWNHSSTVEASEYQLIFPPGTFGTSYLQLDIEPNVNYTLTFRSEYARYYIYEVIDGQLGNTIKGNTSDESYTFNSGNVTQIRITINSMSGNTNLKKIISVLKLEKNSTVTDWTPAPEDITENDNHPLIDKINISLSEPLRAVGDVIDRLFRDSDGLWKVERNVDTSGVEILSQELQDKLNNLRSFQDSNYVYTVSNTDNSPTLHATFKSESWYDDYQLNN